MYNVKKERKKILPLNEKPLLFGYTNFTYEQAILTNHKIEKSLKISGYENWFYINHIQLHCRTLDSSSIDSLPIEFYIGDVLNNKEFIGCPFLDIHWISKDLILSFTNIIEYLIYMIDADYYADLNIDEFYLPNSHQFNKSHFLHQNLIYGYDLEKKELSLFGLSSDRHFRTIQIPFDIFNNAFKDSYLVNSRDYCRPLNFIKYRLPEKYYDLDLNIMISFLEDYLYSRNTNKLLGFCYQAEDRIYGLAIYDILFDIITSRIDDLRILHILSVHKKCMTLRIEYLYKKCLLSDNEYIEYLTLSKQIEELVQITVNLQFKFLNEQNDAIPNKVKKNLSKTCDLEKKLYSELIKILKRYI